MNEWLKENTNINEQEYDSIINSDTITMNGKYKKPDAEIVNTIFDHPLIPIKGFAFQKPNMLHKLIFKVKGNRKTYIHQNIKFKILAEYIKDLSSEYIDIKALTKLLYSKDKLGKCFQLSINIAILFDNSKVVLAMCEDPDFKTPVKFLHSFVIIKKDEVEYVVDGAFNIVIEKKIYFDLLKPNVINEIPGKKAFIDAYYIAFKTDAAKYMGYVDYLCYPKEIMECAKTYTKK